MANIKKIVIYKGLNSNYTEDNNQLILTNIDAVNNQLINLITTYPGEFDFEPDFGSMIPNLLFEQPSDINTWMIGNYLFIAVARWLPEISIDFKNSIIEPLPDSASYYFQLVYSVRGLSGGQVNFITKR